MTTFYDEWLQKNKGSVTPAAVTFQGSQKCDIEPTYDDGRANDFDKHTGKRINRCDVCHVWFFTNRSHAKTCTPTCRKAHSRRKDTFRREARKMHSAIRTVRKLYDQWPDLREFMDAQIKGVIEM